MKTFLLAIGFILTLHAQAQIAGSWHLYGFIAGQNENTLSGSQVITGTLTITATGGLQFDTNLGQFTDEVTVSGSGETYEGSLLTTVGDGSLERSKRIRIQKADDNTLLFSSSDAHYELGELVEYNSAGLILSSEVIEDSGTPSTAWLGTFTVEGIETCEKYPHAGVTSKVISDSVQIFQNTGGVYSIINSGKRLTGFTSAGGKQLEATLILAQKRENLNLLQLNDGRIFGVTNAGALTQVHESEGEAIRNVIDEGFTTSFLLQTTKIGEVSNVSGGANNYILRKGHKITASIGAALQEGDIIVAPTGGSVQVTMIDKTTHSVGNTSTVSNSQLKVEKFAPTENTSSSTNFIYRVIRGAVRSLFKSDPTKRHEITTKTTSLGVRGTEFETTYDEIGGVS